MHDNPIHTDHDQRLHAGPTSTPRPRSRRDTHGPTPSLSKPRQWALVQVWNGAVLATFDDETSARSAKSNADDDEVVVLQVRS
jgi:hypothetical protein